jgi:Cysteine-rich secretory protein family
MSPNRRLRALLMLALSVLVAAPVVLGVTASTASASVPSMESQLLALTNADRAHAGLKPLTSSSTLVSIARSWSAHMASTKQLVHNPSLASKVSGWSSIGENIAMAYSAQQAESMFMASSGHRANILRAAYNRVGIGVSRASDGSYWFTVDFEQTSGYHATPATHSTPTRTHSATRHATSARATTRATRAARASRAATRPALVRTPTVTRPAHPVTVPIDMRLSAIDARLAGSNATVALPVPRPGFVGPDPTRAALVISGGLLVTALAGVALARPVRVRVRGLPNSR